MTRFGNTLLLATILFGGQAWAGQATIKAVTGPVQVGKEGGWKDASPGMVISDTDFVKIPESAKATITLGDSTVKDFAGKAIVPGRRLATEKSAGMMQIFTQGVQKIAGSSDKTTAANGITKADKQGEEAKLAQKKHLNFASTSASDADKDFAAGRYASARSNAQKVLEETSAAASDKEDAHLILGKVLAREGDTLGAIKEFDLALTQPPAASTGFDALLQRGQAYGQIGEDEKAQADLKALLVPDVAASREQVDQARFLLGVMAVEANDRTAAKTYFDALSGGSKPLYDAGMAMLASK